MEHAEQIAEAVSYTKDTFLQVDGIVTWVKLFLAAVIPFAAGYGIATILLQFIIKPLLVSVLVVPTLGFTEAGIAYMLQYLAAVIGILFLFLFPYVPGYFYRSMQNREIRKLDDLFGLFFSGWKVNALVLYYAIPLVVIFLLYAILFTYMNGALNFVLNGDLSGIAAAVDYLSLAVYLILEFATAVFLALFACIGLVHLARTGSLRKAVNMGTIAGIIKRIGWYDYILCIVIITIILLAVAVIFLGLASIFGYTAVANTVCFCLLLFVAIPTGIFVTRYLANIYDTAFTEPVEDIEEFDDF